MPKGAAISSDEKIGIRAAYDELIQKMSGKYNEEDKVLLDRAYELALDAHKTQRRKSGEPYIYHPIEVARICFEEIGLGPTAVISAILHDVVEDTPVTIEEILEMFGKKIATIVDGLTKLDGLYNVESPQAENFKKVVSTLVDDVRVVLIKMADRLHNLRTIDAMPLHKKVKIAAETDYIYSPLAHRLGLYKIKTEFQDIILKITEPEVYHEIVNKLAESEDSRSKYIETLIAPLEKELKSLEISYRVLGRSKAISSIYNKLKTKQVAFEEIYDIFAVRIIIDVPVKKEKSLCWQVYSIITDVYKPIPERLKDWVTNPKSNGYESLHTTVIGPKGRFVEVQIRSERMDEIAEKGFAAHWKYKGIKSENNVYDVWLNNIRELLDSQHNNALEFLNDFKTNLFSEEVYVFTPKGDMMVLPKGATALDFAFQIHSDVGYRATAIKVNNKLVPMGTPLENGDQIHVTTQKNQKPSESWLKWVVTGKAKSKIRSAMKEEKRKQGEFGKEAIQRKLNNMKLNFENNIDFLVKHYGYQSRPELYYAVATNEVKVVDFGKLKVEMGLFVTVKATSGEIAPSDNKKKKAIVENKSKLYINGEPASNFKYSLATCCNPLQGDAIFAYTNAHNETKIHRINCPNATHILANYGYRVLTAEWDTSITGDFIVDLRITGMDTGVGVIQKLTNEISNNLGINIRSFSISGNEGFFIGNVSIIVKNKNQLNQALMAIEKLDGISRVERMDKSSNE